MRLISDGTRCDPVSQILDRCVKAPAKVFIQANIIKLDKKRWLTEYHFCGRLGEKNSIRGLFRLLIRRRVFLETFRTKCPLSLEESSEEMSPAENSPTLLARRAT